MLQWLTKIPIFRRLFLAFFLAAVIPDIIIIIVSCEYRRVLDANNLNYVQTDPLLWRTIFALLVTTVMVIILGYLVNITITRRLRHVVALAKRVARGETDKRVTVTGRDEIYMVASSMNKMLDNIVRLIEQTQGQRDRLQGQVDKLVREVSGVGEGDLRVQAQVTADTLGMLASSFNFMVSELSSLIVRVKLHSQQAEIAATNTYEQMASLVEAAEVQLKRIAAATNEIALMASAAQEVAERIHILDNVAKNAHISAKAGRSTVQQTTVGMRCIYEDVQTTASKVQQLGERSREIGDVVNVIADIAHQTNRLALDATVQAAMAGENGKGFRVVALDIRRLAEQTKEQTSIISRIIQGVCEEIGAVAVSMNDTQRETAAGTDLVQHTGQSLEKIFVHIEQQASEIELINKMVRGFLQSSEQVKSIMQDVSQSTRQNSSGTRVVAQNMEHLAFVAKQLLTSVEAFKIDVKSQVDKNGTDGIRTRDLLRDRQTC